MRNLIILLFIFGFYSHVSYARNVTVFELISNDGNLNGSIDSQIYNNTETNDIIEPIYRNEKKLGNRTANNINSSVEIQNGTASGNFSEKANFAVFNPNFWKSLVGLFQGNVKVGVHGDLSNVASGNLESRGSVGLSVNGKDLTVGAKFGIGGNLGQGVSNTGSIGAGGKFAAKPSIKLTRPKLSLASLPAVANGNYSEINSNGGNGNWQNIKQYFKFFVDRPQ